MPAFNPRKPIFPFGGLEGVGFTAKHRSLSTLIYIIIFYLLHFMLKYVQKLNGWPIEAITPQHLYQCIFFLNDDLVNDDN